MPVGVGFSVFYHCRGIVINLALNLFQARHLGPIPVVKIVGRLTHILLAVQHPTALTIGLQVIVDFPPVRQGKPAPLHCPIHRVKVVPAVVNGLFAILHLTGTVVVNRPPVLELNKAGLHRPVSPKVAPVPVGVGFSVFYHCRGIVIGLALNLFQARHLSPIPVVKIVGRLTHVLLAVQHPAPTYLVVTFGHVVINLSPVR